jgi:hypothetical protein
MRSPRRLLHEIGLGGFLTLQLVVGGNVLAALVHPIFLAGLIYAWATGTPILDPGDGAKAMLIWLYWITLGAGYLTTILLGLRGLAGRGLLSAAWSLAFVWLHWLLLSAAAWRALYQLMRNPYGWEKTEHGLARTSRLAKMTRAQSRSAVFPDRGQSRGAMMREAAE